MVKSVSRAGFDIVYARRELLCAINWEQRGKERNINIKY